MADLSLGEILGEVLDKASAEPEPEPTVDQAAANALVDDTLAAGPIPQDTSFDAVDLGIAAVIARIEREQLAERRLTADAMVSAGRELSEQLAPLLAVTPEDVFQVLGHVPDAMLKHLESPQGWSTLAGYVAGDLGRPLPDYRPTVH